MKSRISNYLAPIAPLMAVCVLVFTIGCSEDSIVEPNKIEKNQNVAPILTSLSIDADSIKINDTRSAHCVASDMDGDSLTYNWTATGGSFAGSGASVTWQAPNIRGLYTITCVVFDGRDAADTSSIEVEVSGWRVLYVGNMSVGALIQSSGVYSHYKKISLWKDAGYEADVYTIGSVKFTDSVLALYDVLDVHGWLHTEDSAEGAAVHRWVNTGGNLLATVTADAMVPLVAPFGVERIDGVHGGSSGLSWSFHGAPLLIGPVNGPEAFNGFLATESMDCPVLTAGHSLTIAATVGGYPAVVYGKFGYGAVVITFAGGWGHDATKSTNAYRATIYRGDNIDFMNNLISYLSK
ncbi:MAG: hypothetical protein NT002_00080 [candidate division Zixibacteria bacterium]|nr:hypothetical protein [candidate division Zixibacteria bacterium]